MAKEMLAYNKHLEALKGTLFQSCASCPGTSGRIEEDGKMFCSRVGAVPVAVTAQQALRCDGTRPFFQVRGTLTSQCLAAMR